MKKNQIRKNHTIKPLVYGIRTAILTAGIAAATSGVVIAGPTGGVIVGGAGQITNPNAQTTIIQQNSQKLVATGKRLILVLGKMLLLGSQMPQQ